MTKPFTTFLCLIILLTACTMAEATPTVTSMPPLQSQITITRPTKTATTSPTATLLRPSTTPIPTLLPTDTPIIVETDIPKMTPTQIPSSTPTPTLSATQMAIPSPPGRLLFTWAPLPVPDGLGAPPPQKLYQAIAEESPRQWYIQTIWDELLDGETYAFIYPRGSLSPDKSKLAFLVWHDINDDDYFDSDRYTDVSSLYTYTIANGEFQQLTEYSALQLFSLNWGIDNQTIFYSQGIDLFSVREAFSPQQLTQNPGVPAPGFMPEKVIITRNPVASPRDNLFVFNYELGVPAGNGGVGINSNNIAFFELQSQNIITTNINIMGSVNKLWSPDGQWLATNQIYGSGLVVINVDTLDTLTLVEQDHGVNFVWSPVDSHLAFVKYGEGVAEIWWWNSETLESNYLSQSQGTSVPVWSPDNQSFAIMAIQDDVSTISVINVITGDTGKIFSVTNAAAYPLTWSPDSQWLALHFIDEDESSGLYVVHRDSGELYQILDTTGIVFPSNIFWLPETAFEP